MRSSREGIQPVSGAVSQDVDHGVATELERKLLAHPLGHRLELGVGLPRLEGDEHRGRPPVSHVCRRRPGLERLRWIGRRDEDAERGHIAAFGKLDPQDVLPTREQVVPFQRPPQATRLDPHDRVDDGVEVLGSAEDRGGDRDLRELVAAAGERLLHDEAQELARALRRVEVGSLEDQLQLAAHGTCPGAPSGPGYAGAVFPLILHSGHDFQLVSHLFCPDTFHRHIQGIRGIIPIEAQPSLLVLGPMPSPAPSR